jgi:predicted nuclease of predicted toxin-antitoxin system
VNFVADESVDAPIVKRLRQQGHVVWSVAEMTPGITDDVVLAIANREAALLITADKDFGELVFRQQQATHGIILIRLAGLPAQRKAELVTLAVSQHSADLLGAFAVISAGAVRIRSLSSS